MDIWIDEVIELCWIGECDLSFCGCVDIWVCVVIVVI